VFVAYRSHQIPVSDLTLVKMNAVADGGAMSASQIIEYDY
jgi:hypothetical protein